MSSDGQAEGAPFSRISRVFTRGRKDEGESFGGGSVRLRRVIEYPETELLASLPGCDLPTEVSSSGD
jgi:hypothetical protein